MLNSAVREVLSFGSSDKQTKPSYHEKSILATPAFGPNLNFEYEPGIFTTISPDQWHFIDKAAEQKLWIARLIL